MQINYSNNLKREYNRWKKNSFHVRFINKKNIILNIFQYPNIGAELHQKYYDFRIYLL